MDQYLGFILLFGGNFNPRNFQLCNGQIVAIQSNTALFSLLGTYWGGNGSSTFGLPDLRGRATVGQGDGPGLTSYVVGEITGNETVTMVSSNIPAHNHLVNAVTAVGNQSAPASCYLAEGPKSGSGPGAKSSFFYNTSAPNTTLNPLSVGANAGGGNTPMSIMQPYLAISYIIATQGIYPARN